MLQLRQITLTFTLCLSLLASTACASHKVQDDENNSTGGDEIADPLEGINRAVFGLNEAVDILYLGPASTIYREGVPQPVQNVFRNFYRNLETPIYAINKLLQADIHGFGKATGRFIVNTVVGVGGLMDVATRMGMPYEPTDFGITLAHWGVQPTFYLVLPLFGPSSLRDGVGQGVDWYADPVRMVAANNDLRTERAAVSVVKSLDVRASVDAAIQDTRKNALDSYATMRSLYVQHREAEIKAELDRLHKKNK